MRRYRSPKIFFNKRFLFRTAHDIIELPFGRKSIVKGCGQTNFFKGRFVCGENMDTKEILSKTDHTLLRPDAVWSEVKEVIDDAIRYKTASVCISPSFVKMAAEYACG